MERISRSVVINALGILLLSSGFGGCAVAAEIDDAAVQKKILATQRFVLERSIHPVTHLVYLGHVNLDDPDRWKNTPFPTKEDYAKVTETQQIVNQGSIHLGMANTSMALGLYVGALLDCYEATRSREWVPFLKSVFEGARVLARASDRKGFIPRSVIPGDLRSGPHDTAVDEYTFYVFALWKYYHSPFSTEAEKKEIAGIIDAMCERVTEDGFEIYSDNGIPVNVGDIGAIRADRSSRLLELYLAGYDLTKNQRWLEIYDEKLKENRYARLRTLVDPGKVMFTYQPRDKRANRVDYGSIYQTQYSLVPLVELEQDLRTKALYVEAMRLNASICQARPGIGEGDMLVILLGQDRSVIGRVASKPDGLYRQWLREQCAGLLMKCSHKSAHAMAIYWLAVKLGLLRYDPSITAASIDGVAAP